MKAKKILLITGIGILTYLFFKKSGGKLKDNTPSPLKKLATDVATSVVKPLDEVAADV